MRVPLSWLREYTRLAEPVDVTEVARRLTAAGLEVESLESVGHDIRGVVIAQVLSIEELTGLRKPIRYCRVAVSEAQLDAPPDETSGEICGATNFVVGDRVALHLAEEDGLVVQLGVLPAVVHQTDEVRPLEVRELLRELVRRDADRDRGTSGPVEDRRDRPGAAQLPRGPLPVARAAFDRDLDHLHGEPSFRRRAS